MAAGTRVVTYDPEIHPAQAEALAEKGLLLLQIARRLKVSRRTVARWKAEHPEFGAAIEAGWEAASDEVVYALYRLATGFPVSETKSAPAESGKGASPRVPGSSDTETSGSAPRTPAKRTGRTRTRKEVPPEFRAVILWLTKRRPGEWGEQEETTSEERAKAEQDLLDRMGVDGLVEALGKLSG